MTDCLDSYLGARHCSEIGFIESLDVKLYPDHKHAAHCFIWSPWNVKIDHKYDAKAAVLMQLRTDGSMGFTGGFVDIVNPNVNDIVDALNRELQEEINLNLNRFLISQEDHHHLFTHIDTKQKLFLHFFELKLSEKEIDEIQRDSLNAEHFNNEVLAVFRVPLYRMKDERSLSGFPLFLNNVFIGNSKQQLLNALKLLQIMTEEEIASAILMEVE